MSVLDNIIKDVSTNIATAATAAGFSTANVLRDEYNLLNFPPDPSAEWILPKGLNVVIKLPEGELQPTSAALVNYDRYLQHFTLAGLVFTGESGFSSAAAALTLSNSAESSLKYLMKQLRVDRSRNSNADNTINFKFSRFPWGDGRGAGWSLDFDVVFRTAFNDPETKG